ncbi:MULTISPECIES: ABC transporter ATP-binding protein [Rhizobium]|uniref:ABC transporter ATP-binding protein n=1 Tax=Rhizobium TaxID=379 RepID=UPI00195A6474|nr:MULTISPECIES: sn-glycerol-3-phosphate ABC transporter ATP-binding protein UgpC [Rhizobium]MBM7044778.1 sn-glycerol-3-phosphate ABC transporter ATP-binding protein UgpC [Rhizobium lusitanum]
MTSLTIRSLKKSYGALTVLHNVNLDIRSGEFVVFVGPSGCGKSTLLRMIAGLEEITSGEIAIDGKIVNDMPPAERGIAMVFQSYALYPHMTVRENMSFGLKTAKMPKSQIENRVNRAAEMLQVTALLDRLPKQLSGGQRQRVAIGRAITREPKVFLFDEPLSNLDAALRVATRIEIAQLKQRMPDTTMIYVTHDQVEAMTLADRIVVMNGGRIEQVGTPMELYHKPANKFVAGFIGSPAMNFIKAEVIRQGPEIKVKTATGDLLTSPFASNSDGAILLGIRPENLFVAEGRAALVRGKVAVVENLGELITAYVDIGSVNQVIVKIPADVDIRIDQTIALSADSAKLHIFDGDGQRRG